VIRSAEGSVDKSPGKVIKRFRANRELLGTRFVTGRLIGLVRAGAYWGHRLYGWDMALHGGPPHTCLSAPASFDQYGRWLGGLSRVS
jgi:hypothetical protein